jgi:hypothetical protein
VWQATGTSVKDRADAISRCFTNGTPIRRVVAVLGKKYTCLRPFSAVWVGPGPEPPKTCGLIYEFGRDFVHIATTADISADPLDGKFTGAGYTMHVGDSSISGPGQPQRGADGSQPFRSLSNPTSAAAGSRGSH